MAARAYHRFNDDERAALRRRQREINAYLADASAVMSVAALLNYKFPRQMAALWALAEQDREELKRMLIVLSQRQSDQGDPLWMGGNN